MVIRRAGASSLGCLVTLLVFVTVAYFGIDVGEAYLRYWRFEDAAQQQVRFAERRTDAEIVAALRAKADSLGLPIDAQRVAVRRTSGAISITSEYTESIELPLAVRDMRFSVQVEGSF